MVLRGCHQGSVRRVLLPGGLIAAVMMVAVMAGGSSARAELFSWTDADGVLHLTNIPPGARRAYRPFKTVPTAWGAPAAGGGEAEAEEGFGGSVALVQTLDDGAQRLLYPVNVTRYDELISQAAEHYRLPFAFIKAIMKVESNFNPRAVSEKQARGLMQLIDGTAQLMNVADPFDPQQNVFAGARYLRLLANMFEGNMALVAAAYNAGPERVLRTRTIPNIPETRQYVRRVLTMYRLYRRSE